MRLIRGFPALGTLYVLCAAIIALVIVGILHARSGPSATSNGGIASNTQTPPKYLVLMVIDGGRPDYLDVTSLPHLDALRKAGTQYTHAVSGILEAETPSGHATISTGSRPDRNGILGFDWGTDESTRYSLFNPDRMDALETILSNSGVPTIAGLYKQQFPQARAVAVSGHKYYAAAPLGGPAADAILYYQGDSRGRYVPVSVPGHSPPASVLADPKLIYPTIHLKSGVEDNLATNLALSAVSGMHPRLLLINYPEFDWPLGHIDGGILDKSVLTTDMKGFDHDLGEIEDTYRNEGILAQTLFVITADHGMMPITHFVPSDEISNAVQKAGTTTTDVASNSGDYIWLTDSTKAQTVADNITQVHDTTIQAAYYLATKDGKPAYLPSEDTNLSAATESANEYLLGALLNGHEPNVVVFGQEGVSFSNPDSNWKADHGGNSWESQHIPLIFSGPGIRAGVTSQLPAQLEDVAPTLLTDMGVKPVGMDGNVLTGALTGPTAALKRSRRAEIAQLHPVLQALRAAGHAAAGGS